MSRRGEVPFVAIRVGRSNDPREVLGLARDLKISRAEALGFVCLWEEMILEVGDAMTGKVAGYDASHLAVKLGWKGQPRRLVDALKRAGLLATHRQTLRHPYWRHSVTGDYAIRRAERREDDRLKKAAQRAAERAAQLGGDVPHVSPGQEGDVPGTSLGNPDRKEGRTSGQPPQPPAEGGGSLGASRWDWLLAHHKRPTDSRACIRYLESLSDENWAIVQWLTTIPEGGGGLISPSKKRVLRLDTRRLLATEAFLQVRPEWVEKLRVGQVADRRRAPRSADPVAERDARRAAEAARAAKLAAAYILEQLADPDLPEDDKEKARQRFRAAHPSVTPPWETIPPTEALASGTATA